MSEIQGIGVVEILLSGIACLLHNGRVNPRQQNDFTSSLLPQTTRPLLAFTCLLRVLKKHVPFPQCGALALNLHIRNDTMVCLLLRALCFKDASMLTFVLVAHGTVGCWTSLRSVTWQ